MVRVRQASYHFESKEIQFKLMCFMVSLHIGIICAGQLETNVCGTICKCENYQTVVRCENLNLTSVPKAIPETVTSLYLEHNEITNIEDAFKNLVNLKHLYLGHNAITNIGKRSLQELRDLKSLYLENNEIRNIEVGAFKNLANLKILDLVSNNIANIENTSWEHLSNLQELYLNNNTIKDIGEGTFKHLPDLTMLHLGSNKITNIEETSLQHLQNLQELYLNNNAIKDIGEGTFKHLPNLKKLDLSSNKITHIEETSLQHLRNLQELSLNNNAIKDIREGTFRNLPNLKKLHLGSNKITNIEETSLQHLQNLQYLYLYNNAIKDIGEGTFTNLPNLKILNLGYNQITNIEEGVFKTLQNLKKLNLNYNQIKECEDGAFSFLSNITNIDLRNNKDMICGCQIPAFVYFIKRTYNRHVNVLGYCHTVLGNNQTKLIRTQDPSHCKNYSLFQQKLLCQTCSGVMCNDSEVTSCSDAEPVCMSRISMSGVTQKTEKSCSTYTKCVEALRNNTFTCNKWTSGTSCSACCTGNVCNKKDLIGWNNSFVLNLLYTMNPYLTSDNRTRKSDEYISLLENISRTLEYEFLNLKGEYTVEFCGLQQQIEIFTIYCRVLSEMTVEQLKQDISNILNTSKTLRNLGIQRGDIELIDEMLCNENTTLDNDYTLAWPVTKVGNTVIIPCHGNVATRRCSSRTEVHLEIPPTQCLTSPDHSPFTGVWEEPDMSQCNNTDWTTREVKQIKSIDIDKGWNNSFVLNLLYTMNPYLTSDNQTRKSDEYISLLENISRTLEYEFLNLKGEYTVEFCGLQQQIEIFTIYCRVLSEITVEQLKQDISNILNTSKTLRNLGIQRGNIELIDEMLCNENTTLDNNYTLAWPVTKVGNTVIIPCHGNVATRRCSSRTEEVHLEIPPTQCLTSPDHSPFTGVWEEPDMSQCNNTDWITRGLKDRKSQVIDKEHIEDLSKQLLNISHKSEYLKEITNDLTERIMPRISNMSAKTTTNYILLINNMINTPEKSLVEAEQSNRIVSRMLDIIRTIPEEIQLEKQQLTVLYSNLGIGVTKVEKDTFNGLFYGISCATNETAARGMIYMSSYPDHQQLEDITMTDYISLPKSLLSHLKEEERSTISRITFSSLLNDKLYRVIQTSGNKTNSKIKQFINSRIMAANIPNIPMTNLDEPVTMSFSLLHKNATNPRCVYWDETPGHWSTKGCNIYNMVPGEKVSCSCNHLTSFALLMDVYQNEVTVKNLKPVSVISNIGCGISFVFLVLTVIFHVCFKDLWKIIASKILVNYCSSLAVTYLIFLVGMPPYAAKTIVDCKAVAALLHYFLLVSIMWMTVEALHICLVVFVLSRTYESSFMMRSSMFAWGLPAVIVILTLAINYTNNYIRIAEVCWLSRTSFYAAFLIPVVIILLFNLIIFSLIIWRLISMQNDNKFERKTRKVRVFGIVGLFFLLSLIWILAFLTFGEAAIVYKYLFAIFNTLQGLFIFIFYCIYKKDSRNIISMNVCKRNKYKLQRGTKRKTSRCSRSGNESDAGKYDNIADSDL